MPEVSPLSLESDLHSFFLQLLKDAAKSRGDALDPMLEAYLLGLLEDEARGSGIVAVTLADPLALQLAAALSSPLSVRFEKLRQLGDGALLLSGLFRAHLNHQGLADHYVRGIGRRAYLSASTQLGLLQGGGGLELEAASPPDLLGTLAEQFAQWVELLRDVSAGMLALARSSSRALVQLCELWLERRSRHLEQLLLAQGLSFKSGPRPSLS